VKPRLDPRVFIALLLSRTAQERLAECQRDLQKYMVNWHFIPAFNFHMTLRFFGEVPERNIVDIDTACRQLCTQFSAFNLHWDNIGFFGNPRNARVIYAAADDSPELASLARRIADVFPQHDDRQEFRPHITLAKARKHIDPGQARINANMLRRLGELGRVGPEKIQLDLTTVHREFVLMETVWVGRAVEYVVRQRYPLQCSGQTGPFI
jgi:RNA 2',3'-cyclic 3'-phosphodiesterase